MKLNGCGGFEPLLPVLIDIGLDAIHALQPCFHGMNPAMIKETCGDKIVLNQHMLIEGFSTEFVRKKTLETLQVMALSGATS